MKATNRGRPGLFAQLLGFSKSNTSAEEPEDDKDDKAEDDTEGDGDEGEKNDKSSKAEDDDGGEDDDAEDDKDDEKAKGAHAERQRCARIIAHGIKVGSVEQAGVLAFDSDLTAKAAISTLDAMGGAGGGASGRGKLGSRMSAVKPATVGHDGGAAAAPAGSAADLAARMVGAYQKANGSAKG